jgi:predicted small lipoprotein YifL
MNSLSVVMAMDVDAEGAGDDLSPACYDSSAMLREIAASPRPLAAAAAIVIAATMLAGCGIKGPLKLPPAAAPAATPVAAPGAPAASAPAPSPDDTPAAAPAAPAPK